MRSDMSERTLKGDKVKLRFTLGLIPGDSDKPFIIKGKYSC